jgi:selenocysteine-specific translation elongation factor
VDPLLDARKNLRCDLVPQSDRIKGAEVIMARVPLDDDRLKKLFKKALLEVLEERKDLLREIIEETLEDIALARAIEQGQRTPEVSRSEVFSLLEGGH